MSVNQSIKTSNQNSTAVAQTKVWLEKIVIGLNFCPFAKKEFVNNRIFYHDSKVTELETALVELSEQLNFLHSHDELETSLLIYSQGFTDFGDYLTLLDFAEQLLLDLGYEGIFQLASFHPDYCFAGDTPEDVTNYTNKSPWPTLHVIREDSMAKVLASYKQPEQIPEDNIALAQAKGCDYFKQVLADIKTLKGQR